MSNLNLPWVKQEKLPWMEIGNSLCLPVKPSLYSLEAILKTCYLFLDQCYMFVNSEDPDRSEIQIYFTSSDENSDLEKIVAEFSNRLIWQEVRQTVANETQTIREVIVAQALTEGNFIDKSGVEADYNLDPLKIAQ